MPFQTSQYEIYASGNNLRNRNADMYGKRLGALVSGSIGAKNGEKNEGPYNLEIEAYDEEFKYLAILGIPLSKKDALSLAQHIYNTYPNEDIRAILC